MSTDIDSRQLSETTPDIARRKIEEFFQEVQSACDERRKEFESQLSRAKTKSMRTVISEARDSLNSSLEVAKKLRIASLQAIEKAEQISQRHIEASSKEVEELDKLQGGDEQLSAAVRQQILEGNQLADAAAGFASVRVFHMTTLVFGMLAILIRAHDSTYEKMALEQLREIGIDAIDHTGFISMLRRLRTALDLRGVLVDEGDKSAEPFERFAIVIRNWPNLCERVQAASAANENVTTAAEDWLKATISEADSSP